MGGPPCSHGRRPRPQRSERPQPVEATDATPAHHPDASTAMPSFGRVAHRRNRCHSEGGSVAATPGSSLAAGRAGVQFSGASHAGDIVVDGRGLTLYLFTGRTAKSRCYGAAPRRGRRCTSSAGRRPARDRSRPDRDDQTAQGPAAGHVQRPPALLLRRRGRARRDLLPGRLRVRRNVAAQQPNGDPRRRLTIVPNTGTIAGC